MQVRKTKIVATIGPACRSEGMVARLIRAGVDAFRLNFSHGTHQEHAEVIERIRRLAREAGRAVAVLQDLQGARLRTGPLEGGSPVVLHPGERFVLTTEQVSGTQERVSVSYPQLSHFLKPGDHVLLADGALELEVTETTPTEVRTVVVRGGPLGERKGINLPGVQLAHPFLSEKDLQDMAFGVQQGVDYVALSFVRRPEDIHAARAALHQMGGDAPLIAKIEHSEAVRHLNAILIASEGVMVARGDLGVEMGPEKVPILQKQIIRRANEFGIPSITATQMLESMVHSPYPTRAEASDVANAILDGTDAVMLSEETAVGQFPVEAVETMDRIAREVESAGLRPDFRPTHQASHAHSLAHAAKDLAEEVGARAIVVFTRTGYTARILSKLRPLPPIYAFTASEAVFRRLALWHGVVPLMGQFPEEMDRLVESLQRELQARGLAEPGDRIVVARFSPPDSRRHFNFLTVRTIPRPRRRHPREGKPPAVDGPQGA